MKKLDSDSYICNFLPIKRWIWEIGAGVKKMSQKIDQNKCQKILKKTKISKILKITEKNSKGFKKTEKNCKNIEKKNI